MPVERVDINIPSALTADVASAIATNRAQTQENIGETDRAASTRKAVEKKVSDKRATIKQSEIHRHTVEQSAELQQRMQQIMGGAAGPDAANALASWGNNKELQTRLTEAQKQTFFTAMAENPRRATEAGNALDRLMQQPGFNRAVTTTQQMGTLQAGLLQNPRASEGPATQLLQSRFLQSNKADPQTKNQCLRFGMQQAAQGNNTAIKRSADMLGSLVDAGVPRGAQRSAMRMAERTSTNPTPANNVDSFVKHADIRNLPLQARGKAVELLSKANGSGEVKEGFELLASANQFKNQSSQNKGRFYATVGSGRPSEYRAVTDQLLVALKSNEFPNREGQVSRFLGKMATQVQRGGADSVDTPTLIRESKKSALPTAPKLQSTEGLSEDEALRVRAQNRGLILNFFNQLERLYERAEKSLASAKFLEDVNNLLTLRAPPDVDTSALSPEELAIYESRKQSVGSKRSMALKLQQQRGRELRNKRMPPAKRRALAAERRAVGQQKRYFRPDAGGRSASDAFLAAATGTDPQPTTLGTPHRSLRSGSAIKGSGPELDFGAQGLTEGGVATALSGLGGGPLTPEKVAQVAQAIGQQVARQVVEQVTARLLSTPRAAPTEEAAESSPATTTTRKQTVLNDGWGVQRVFDRDLGGPQPEGGRRASTREVAVRPEETKYTGRRLVNTDSAVRTFDELLRSEEGWTSLSPAEQTLLRNLGWNGRLWEARNNSKAMWPPEMGRTYKELAGLGQVGISAKQDAVRRLGFSPGEWDKRIQALKMGKNA